MSLIGLLVFSISSLFSYLNTGADRSKMLRTEVYKTQQYNPNLTWAPLNNIGRRMDQQTLRNVEKNYMDAWYVKHIAYETNDIKGIEDFYTDSAEKNLFEFINFNKKENIHIEETTLDHNPKINFFSEDGQLVSIIDYGVKEYKRIYKNDSLIIEKKEVFDYKTILLLEDGFWRIRHLVKEPSQKSYAQKINFEPYPNHKIKGINYYPQNSAWDTFGDDFNKETLAKDFDIIAAAGLNTIRIFIQYDDFGKAELIPEKLNKLKDLLDIAEKKELKVIVTLFDFYGDYSVLDWTLTTRHAQTIVQKFKEHNAILAWDVKNEPDLDFKSRGKEKVIAWLHQTISTIKKIDQKHAITVGWAKIESATLLKDRLNLITFHYYEDINLFKTAYLKLKQEIPNKPIALGEFGVSSYRGIWKPYGSSESTQEEFHKTMQTIFKENDIQFLSWTLYDYKNIPTAVVGRLPWRKNAQKKFGFIDNDGKPKKSFKYISN
ncbi:glycoside hydrolase family 2 TIM barrel-domain containing protein [Bacteroidota bacterium]